MDTLLRILHEDTELLVLDKPPDLVCHPTKAGELSSLIGRVRLYLGSMAPAHLVNRLDRETSGVVMVAKTAQGASTRSVFTWPISDIPSSATSSTAGARMITWRSWKIGSLLSAGPG